MSPEQASGRNDELDDRSDQYALGLILQETVTLVRAVGDGTVEETIARVRDGHKAPMVAELAGTRVPRELAAIVRKATQRAPENRYRSVAELAADVRRYLQGDEVTAERDRLLQRLGRWVSKHRMASLGIIMVVLALAGVATAVGVTLAYDKGRLERAHRHELQLSHLLSRTAYRGHGVDKELHRYEAALKHVIGAAEEILSRDADSTNVVHLGSDFVHGSPPPDDLAPSTYYGRAISLRWPVFVLAPGVDRDPLMPELRRLSWLPPVFRDVMLESGHAAPDRLTPTEQRELIGTRGVPIHRVFVSLADGAQVAYPGMQPLHGSQDARQQPPYQRAARKPGMHWGAPYPDPFGPGLVLACSSALYDDGEKFRGVAGIEVALSHVVEHLLDMSHTDYVRSTLLVDGQGTILARRRAPPAGKTNEAHRGPLEFPEVVDAIREGRSGYFQTQAPQRRTIVYQPLEANDWYFVAIADTEAMLASTRTLRPIAPHPRSTATTVPSTTAPSAASSALLPAPAASGAPPTSPTASATAGSDAGADALSVQLAVGPAGVAISVDGTPVSSGSGQITLTGAEGSVHTVVLRLGEHKTTAFVTITAEGPRPTRVVASPPPQPAPPEKVPPSAAPASPEDIY
jgi:hypothetical protein